MRAPHKSSLLYFAVIASATCVFCAFAACAAAAPATGTVSLSQLASPAPLQALAPNGVPLPNTPFTPSYFGGTTTFPANGNDYVKTGSNAAPQKAIAGLEGRGPHGGYDTTTYKCGVCHAAHGAGSNAAAAGSLNDLDSQSSLLRAGTTGCEYCHVGSTGLFSSDQVYTNAAEPGNVADLGANNSGHPITGQSVTVPASKDKVMTLECTSCHSIHGVLSNWMPTDFYTDGSRSATDTATYGYKLLLSNPGGDPADAAPNKAATAVTDPGADPAAVNQFSFSAWCASCHNNTTSVQAMTTAATVVSQDTTFTASTTSGSTHTTSEIANGSSGSIKGPHDSTMTGTGMGALQCYTCHRGGGLSAEVPAPDAQTAAELTALGYTPPTNATCSLCHYGTADFATDPANLNGTSDWPHSSAGDVDLLGGWTVNFADLSTPAAQAVTGGVTKANAQETVCGRCHPVASKTSATITFNLSPHGLTHSYPVDPLTGSWETSQTIGTLGDYYSPGYSAPSGN